MRKQLLIALGILIITGALLACGAASNNTGTLAGSSAPTSGAAPTQAPAKHFKVGDIVNIGSTWQVTVNSAQISAGDDISKPKDGNEFITIDVSLKNTSNAEQTASSLGQWVFRDASGKQYNLTFTTQAAPDGKVEPGSPLRGVLTYEVPTSTKSFTLAFEASIVDSGQTIWDISV